MKKRFLSVLLSLAMIFSLLPMAAFAAETDKGGAASFPDAANHWGKASIERWAGYGVLNGDDKGNFNPDNPMTRAEFSTMLVNLMGYTEKAKNSFADVDTSDWYADAILKLAAAGIMKGDGTNANPNAYISRQEAAVLLCRVFGIEGGSSVTFADKSSIASWAADAVAALSSREMIAGVGNNMFAPLDNINRASVAKMIDNMISTFVPSGTVEVSKSTDGIVLVAGGNVTIKDGVTVANLMVAPKASGSTVTVEKNATVTTMDIAGANAAVKGAGAVKTLTVTGSGATVDKAVTVTKLINDSSADIKYGDKTIKAGEDSDTSKTDPVKPSGGGGGGGGGSSTATITMADKTYADQAAFNAAFKAAVEDTKKTNVVVNAAHDDYTLEEQTIVIEEVAGTKLTINFGDAEQTVTALSITDDNVKTITLNGANTTITALEVNTPAATVTNNVLSTGTATITGISKNTYVAAGNHTAIEMNTVGTLNVTAQTAPAVTVTVPDGTTTGTVTLQGTLGAVAVNRAPALAVTDATAASVTIDDATTTATLTNVEAAVVTTKAPTTVTGTSAVATLTVANEAAADIIVTVDTEAAVTGLVVEKAGATVAGAGAIETITANENVTVSATEVNAVAVGTNATKITVTGTVNAVEADKNVTIAGTGTVATVDVAAAEGSTVTVTAGGSVKIDQVTNTDAGTVAIAIEEGSTAKAPDTVVKKAAKPAGITAVASQTEIGKGTVTGVNAAMEYATSRTAADWTKVESAVTTLTLASDTYYFRVAETGADAAKVLASESVQVVVPNTVGIATATISGLTGDVAVVGDKLTVTAAPNNYTGGDLQYQWYLAADAEGQAAEIENATTNTYTAKSADAGKYICCNVKDTYTAEAGEGIFTKAYQVVSATATVTSQAGLEAALTASYVTAINVTDSFRITKDLTINKPTTIAADESITVGEAATLTLNAAVTGDGAIVGLGDTTILGIGADGSYKELAKNTSFKWVITNNEGAWVKAEAAQTYTVIFNLDAGAWADEFEAPATYTAGTALTLPVAANLTKQGYTFAGWYTTEELTGDAVTSIAADATGNKIFYAKWTEETGVTTLEALQAALAAAGATTVTLGADIAIEGTEAAPVTVTVGEGQTLVVPAGVTLTIGENGTLANNGTLDVSGTVENTIADSGVTGILGNGTILAHVNSTITVYDYDAQYPIVGAKGMSVTEGTVTIEPLNDGIKVTIPTAAAAEIKGTYMDTGDGSDAYRVPKADCYQVDGTLDVNFDLEVTGTLIVTGAVNVEADNALDIEALKNGTMAGTLEIKDGGEVTVANTASMAIVTATKDGATKGGTVAIDEGGTLTNNGTIENCGCINLSGTLTSQTDITKTGSRGDVFVTSTAGYNNNGEQIVGGEKPLFTVNGNAVLQHILGVNGKGYCTRLMADGVVADHDADSTAADNDTITINSNYTVDNGYNLYSKNNVKLVVADDVTVTFAVGSGFEKYHDGGMFTVAGIDVTPGGAIDPFTEQTTVSGTEAN